MTLLEVLYTVQHIAQLVAKPAEMTIEQFNNMLRLAQDELFKEFAHGYLSGNGAEVDARITAAILPFRKDETPTAASGSVNGITCHSYTLNALDYVVLSAQAVTSSSLTGFIKVDIVTSEEFVDRCVNAVTYPKAAYPIGYLTGTATSKVFYLLPLQGTAPTLTVTVLRRPTSPVLVETITNGVRTQSGSSTALEIDAMFHIDIVRKILKYLGIAVNNEFISVAMEEQKNQEK
jgi:hypothetical protein